MSFCKDKYFMTFMKKDYAKIILSKLPIFAKNKIEWT